MRRNRVFILLCSAVLFEIFLLGQTATASDLTLFQRYFGTMDYSVTGTGSLSGSGKRDEVTGEYLTGKAIPVVFPRTANLVAAFLYWGSHEISPLPSSARGYLSYPTSPNARVKILGKPVGPTDQIVPCWNTGGSDSTPDGGAPLLRLYRADILRYLKAPGSNEVAPEITVRLRDGGETGSDLSVTEGATLVLVYRHPALRFKSIVIYDGAQIMGGQQDEMSTVLKGFDQATKGEAKLTHIVGNGQQNFPEVLSFNGTVLERNPFRNGWDNKTYNVSNLMGNVVDNVNTTVRRDGTPFDCLSQSAVVFSTTVLDTDQDGLLDVWETSGFKDLDGSLLVDLPAWVAGPLKKDLLVEIDYMYDNNPGLVHSHRPKSEALQMIGDAFKNAPVGNPDGSTGIHLVFDVGVFPPSPNPANVVGNPYLGNPYVATSGALEGGDPIDERGPGTYCTTYVPGTGDTPASCMFPNQPGLISWKKGFQRIKNHNFLPDRTNLFHYAVFGHGLALQRKDKDAVAPFTARSVSGRADLGGNSLAVTVGLWQSAPEDALVGSANLQAATFLHELAHNLYGFHGGITLQRPLTILDAIVPRPNCNPNKQSSLNYLYQSAGLIDEVGVFRVNLSGESVSAIAPAEDEQGLDEAAGLGAGSTAYRLRWYAPLENLQGQFEKKNGVSIPLPAVRSYCDGSNAAPIENSGLIRVNGGGVPGNPLARMPVDWDADGTIANMPRAQDINFNGKADNVTDDFAGFNDWASIIDLRGLQQVGAGRNLFGLSLGVAAKHLLQAGEDDLGEDDLGEDDLGEDDLGEDDLGEDDLGEDDLGEDDLGETSEMDEDLAIAIGGNGPSGLNAVVSVAQRRVQLKWTAPAFGGAIDHYSVYRSTNGGLFEELTPTTRATSYTDSSVQNNQTYRYRIIAVFGNPDGVLSNPSTTVTVTP